MDFKEEAEFDFDLKDANNKKEQLKWIGPDKPHLTVESDEVTDLITILKVYNTTNQNNKLNNRMIECLDHINNDISDILKENNIIPILIEQIQKSKPILKSSSYKLLIKLSQNSVVTAQYICEQFDFFSYLLNAPSHKLDILKLITVFLFYCNNLTENVINNDIFHFLFTTVIENFEDGAILDASVKFMIAFLNTQNSFPESCFQKHETLYSDITNILEYFLSLNKETIQYIENYDQIIQLLLCTLASNDEKGLFADIMKENLLSKLYFRFQKIENLNYYLIFLNLLVTSHPDLLVFILENSPLLSSLMRLFNIDNSQVLDFFINFSKIGGKSAALLLEGQVLNIFADVQLRYEFVEGCESVMKQKDIIDVLDIQTKEKYFTLFFILAQQIPRAILDDDRVYAYVDESIYLLEGMSSDFLSLLVKALNSLFANDFDANKLGDVDSFCEFLEEISINNPDMEIQSIARTILKSRFEKYE